MKQLKAWRARILNNVKLFRLGLGYASAITAFFPILITVVFTLQRTDLLLLGVVTLILFTALFEFSAIGERSVLDNFALRLKIKLFVAVVGHIIAIIVLPQVAPPLLILVPVISAFFCVIALASNVLFLIVARRVPAANRA